MMRTTRLTRKKVIQERRLLKQEVKSLEKELDIKEATRRQIVEEIMLTSQLLDEKKARLATLEQEN